MGAAEWTGYSGTTPSYSPFSSLQSTPSSYGYDNSSIPEHHSNFHIPTVISDIQPLCSTDYHHSGLNSSHSTALIPTHQASSNSSNLQAKSSDLVDTSYTYNNWSNGYNNYQYGSCTPQPQYAPHAGPTTMVLYPHVYSTVNHQNQIHLHLHGSDKLEQYLGSENSLTISSARGGIEIGIGTTDESEIILENGGNRGHNDHLDEEVNRVDSVGGDPGSVWRPY
ncbi:Protein lozenge [Pseudolycoriella hygida]|uniref:Protein lozenge n=1 Tax=Pseudolycoriella hygida TaxID=35572 RepID=A0A9Q0MUT3_9DIPT|nr:Protein lozenge [Pseudolycoriella hygida]